MIRTVVWALVILGVLLLLQTTLMNYISLWGVKPHLVLLLFVFLASQNGSLPSLFVGFFLGLSIDFLSPPASQPLGYHAFIYTLAGYLFGLGKGKVYLDPVVVPMLMGFAATFYEAILSFLLSSVFNLGGTFGTFFNTSFLIQLVLNVIGAPIVFFFLSFFKQRFQDPRRGFDG